MQSEIKRWGNSAAVRLSARVLALTFALVITQ